MPRLDGTGPMGQGSMTGRGMGNCRPQMRRGLGQGQGQGQGRGWRRWFGFSNQQVSQPTKEEEIGETKSNIQEMEQEIKDMQNYLKDLESKK